MFFVVVVVVVVVVVFLGLQTTEGSFSQRVHLYIWAVAGHDLGILSIEFYSFANY